MSLGGQRVPVKVKTIRGLSVARGEPLIWGKRTYVMGIINVTPDSFSGDGLGGDVSAALDRALRMEDEGADFLDVGAESTRPGAEPVAEEEELARLLPALEAIAPRVGIPISVDTYKAAVARRAMAAGAVIINDIWGLKAGPSLAAVAAGAAALVIMHNQATRSYQDLLPEVFASLSHSVELAKKAGVPDGNIILDPGIGFGKTPEHNLEVLRRLAEFKRLGYPLMVGTSRKSTIRLVLDPLAYSPSGRSSRRPAGPPADKSADKSIEGTAATVALAIGSGADIVRVHDVKEMVRVCQMSDAVVREWRPENWTG